LDKIKNHLTEPVDERRMIEIGLERIAKYTNEKTRKKIR
jgi:hypothetical protein